MNTLDSSSYPHDQAAFDCSHAYLLPSLQRTLSELVLSSHQVFDLGCGTGVVANWLSEQGFKVTGCDPSESGIAAAQVAFPHLKLCVASAYDNLSVRFGTFPLVVSLEVVEHVYAPRAYTRCIYNLLEPGGYAILSTPYHGYWKNLALAVTGRMDAHFTALWDHGHIKFWSPQTLTQLLSESGFRVEKIVRIGRIPAIAKTMMILARRVD